MERPWDAVVVGAGPAGSATAARLAARGHRVLILDRDAFPRAKPCGECLSPAAVDALESLGALERVRGAGAAAILGWRIFPGAALPFAGAFPAGRPGLALSRDRLDAILLEHARERGATVRLQARVVDLVRQGGRVTGVRLAGGEEVGARLVVGADGLRSVVVRRLGLLRRAPRLRKLALTAHLAGAEGRSGRGELHAFPWGCVGVAEVEDGLTNVTVVICANEARRVAGARESYFDDAVRAMSRFAEARRVSDVLATGPFDWPTRGAVADGALLVGDAAGYYDPFTGQGIFRALRGAELAAGAADASLRSGDLSARALAAYDRSRSSQFDPGVKLQHLVEAFVSRPGLLAMVAGRLRRRPALADALVAVTGDLHPVRTLLAPRLLAQLLA